MSDVIAVLRRNVEGIADALSSFIAPFSYEAMSAVFGEQALTFEKISLKSISLAGEGVRRRSYEAVDLESSMAIAGVHRSIPNSFRTRSSAGIHTIGPGTSRISRKDARCDLNDLVRYVLEAGEALKHADANYPRIFLSQFARALPLTELPDDAAPNAILFDLSKLKDDWEQSPGEYQFELLSTSRADEGRVLSEKAIHAMFGIAEQVLEIRDDEILYASPAGRERPIGSISMNKNTITVRSGLLERLRITERGRVARMSSYLNGENSFVITFSNPAFGYSERQLFRDSALLGSIDSLLEIFEPRPELGALTAEKAVQASEFGPTGIFRFVEDLLSPSHAALVCDDLGDEWADYVMFDPNHERPRLSFVHCKHGKTTSSASALQEPLGQAVKNLSRMHRTVDAFLLKTEAKWQWNYSDTQIPRIRKGGPLQTVKEAIATVVRSPHTEREVLLVLTGISLKNLRKEFDSLKKGSARPHVSQLLWMLTGFWSSCREHGVRARIVCQP